MKSLSLSVVVPHDHPSLPGHFPNAPVVPGVLLLDLILSQVQSSLAESPCLTTLSSAKFLRPVLPDQAIAVHCSIESESPGTWRVSTRATCGADPVLEAAFVLVKKSNPESAKDSDHG